MSLYGFILGSALGFALLLPCAVKAQTLGRDLDCPGPGCPSIRLVSSTKVSVGSHFVQLAAFNNIEEAINEAESLFAQVRPPIDTDQGFYFELATSGGRDFVRLRFGPFEGAQDSRAFCAPFIARERDCIPILIRNVPDRALFRENFEVPFPNS